MSGQYRENWKRLVNKLPQSNTSKDDPDVVRFRDQGCLTTNASGIGGIPLPAGTPASGDLIIFDGTAWVYSSGSLTGGQTIDGFPIVGTPASGDMLAFNGTAWVYVASGVLGGGGGGAPTGPAGGDLTSNYPNPQVSGIRGVQVAPTTPLLDQTLVYDGTRWVPNYPPGLEGSVTVGQVGTSEVPNPKYSSVGAAIAAGHKNIHIVSQTVDGVVNFPSGADIKLHDAHWATTIAFLPLNFNSAIRGPGKMEVKGLATTVVGQQGSAGPADKKVVTLENLEIIGDVAPHPLGKMTMNNCIVDGQINCNGPLEANNITIRKLASGSGTLTGQALTVSGTGIVNVTNIMFEGSAFTAGNIISVIPFPLAASDDARLGIDGISFRNVPPTALIITVAAPDTRIANLRRNYGTIQFGTTNSSPKYNCMIENCIGDFTSISNSTPIVDWRFSNCVGSGVSSLLTNADTSSGNMYDNCKIGNPTLAPGGGSPIAGGQEHTYNNVTFYQDLTIRGRRHIFTGCRFWGNVTLDASTSGCLVVGSRVEGTLTDNGTDNVT